MEYGMYAKFTFEEDIDADDFVRCLLHEGDSYWRCDNDVFVEAEDVDWILKNIVNDWNCEFELNDKEIMR